MTELTGRCLCGDIRIALTPPFLWQGHCHCDTCRRQTASPFTSFIGVANGQWRIDGSPQIFRSSPDVERLFCGRCGSPVAYRADRWPGEVHFYAASLDNPGASQPSFHVFASEALPWCQVSDDLPRFTGIFGSKRL